jgi:colicin import membrane protein
MKNKNFKRDKAIPATLSVLVHIAFGALFVASLDFAPKIRAPNEPEVEIIQATAVNEKMVQAELDKLKKIEARKRSEEDKRQRELESEADRARKKREAEEMRLAELKEKKEQEKQNLAALEKKKKADAERAAKEAEQLKKLEAERKAKQDEVNKLALQRKMEEDAVREKERQEALKKQKEREQAAQRKRVEGVVKDYALKIQAKVQGLWNTPTNFSPGSFCEVNVKLIPGGEIVSQSVSKCNADEVFRNSVETAVAKASPLPVPVDPAEFDEFRDFNFRFAPVAKQ